MLNREIDRDTQAILLLHCYLGKEEREDFSPLSLKEHNLLVSWLDQHDLSPRNLLELGDDDEVWIRLRASGIHEPRVKGLLGRGALLALQLEKWTNAGIWVIGRHEEKYPQRWKNRLKPLAPPILFGIGNIDLLDLGGLAIVGSRTVKEEEILVTRFTAHGAADNGIQVVSGGAKGVDRESMLTALESSGTVVGVLADSLSRQAVTGKYRNAILDGRLTLVSPHNPDSHFNIGYAMSRNKLIYTLADRALVVRSDYQRGGTWSGAMENLDSGWVPMYVYAGNRTPKGNSELISNGAHAVRLDNNWAIEFPEWTAFKLTEKEQEEAAESRHFSVEETTNQSNNSDVKKEGEDSSEQMSFLE